LAAAAAVSPGAGQSARTASTLTPATTPRPRRRSAEREPPLRGASAAMTPITSDGSSQ
jgi:hypothetical protein